jgi:two-component system, sporulation sensor kinase D
MRITYYYDQYQKFKLIFILIAIMIVLPSMYLTHLIVDKLSQQEMHTMEVWAEATRQLAVADDNADMTLVLKVLNGNTTIPAVLVDSKDQLVNPEYGICNIELPKENKEEFLKEKIQKLKKANPPIVIQIDQHTKHYVYYDESSLLKNLGTFSYSIFGVVGIFLVIAFMVFSNTKKVEQNQVWVGLSKETAHQLGTPISSLLAWVELLKSKHMEDKLIDEMSKDVNRLRIIADRFSKIGSKPTLEAVPLPGVLDNAVTYIKNRTSNKVVITTIYEASKGMRVNLNVPLFEWVIENLCKNAIDAMDGDGRIDITVTEISDSCCIDIKDTGKGIPKSKFKTVFNPGYTTKKRGWGLGLSLVKRIVDDYHAGKIFVKQSEIGKGTTFRIILKKAIENKKLNFSNLS